MHFANVGALRIISVQKKKQAQNLQLIRLVALIIRNLLSISSSHCIGWIASMREMIIMNDNVYESDIRFPTF